MCFRPQHIKIRIDYLLVLSKVYVLLTPLNSTEIVLLLAQNHIIMKLEDSLATASSLARNILQRIKPREFVPATINTKFQLSQLILFKHVQVMLFNILTVVNAKALACISIDLFLCLVFPVNIH